jgi:hypothetical protein
MFSCSLVILVSDTVTLSFLGCATLLLCSITLGFYLSVFTFFDVHSLLLSYMTLFSFILTLIHDFTQYSHLSILFSFVFIFVMRQLYICVPRQLYFVFSGSLIFRSPSIVLFCPASCLSSTCTVPHKDSFFKFSAYSSRSSIHTVPHLYEKVLLQVM